MQVLREGHRRSGKNVAYESGNYPHHIRQQVSREDTLSREIRYLGATSINQRRKSERSRLHFTESAAIDDRHIWGGRASFLGSGPHNDVHMRQGSFWGFSLKRGLCRCPTFA
jgi:hypothetical protein